MRQSEVIRKRVKSSKVKDRCAEGHVKKKTWLQDVLCEKFVVAIADN